METVGRCFRGRVLSPQRGGYTARTLLELDLRAAIGAVLDKRAWWAKWDDPGHFDHDDQESDDAPTIRDKWLDELERTLVTSAVIPRRYTAYPRDASEDERRVFVDTVCATVPYNLIWHRDECQQLSRGEDDAAATAAETRIEDETLEAFRQHNASMQPYGQLTWYFELVLLNKALRALPLSEWQAPQRVRVGSKQAASRAAQFILAARRGEVTKETFASFMPDGDTRPKIVDALWVHVDRILKEVSQIRDCITRSLERVIMDHELDTEPKKAPFISPGCVQETWMSDQLIADELKHKFVAEVAVLESVPDDDKDWHPESNNQVLDLVHPSLYCCVFGKTKRIDSSTVSNDGTTASRLGPLERMQRMLFGGAQLVENSYRGEAQYQWIPSDIAVDSNGRSTILSYINNLHPEKHGAMYDSIARIFDAFVPMFDRVLSWLLNDADPRSEMQYGDYWRVVDMIPNHPPIPWSLGGDETEPSFSIRGRVVQVIVKIAEIRLTPENPTYPGGTWHVEGSDAEQIVATGIYYFGCENITESKLAFRVIVQEPEHRQDDTVGMRAMYGLARGEPLVQYLGSVTAFEDRCIVFPNTLQHRVEPFELEVKTKPGVRKILAFFLVDPSKRIPSTSLIPPQRADWIREGLDPVLDHLRKTKSLPEGVADKTVTSMVGTRHGMTLEEAKQHRLGLMHERRANADESSDEDLVFSLCEH